MVENEQTQSYLTTEKLAERRYRVAHLHRIADRQQRLIREQTAIEDDLVKEETDQEGLIQDLSATLKLNDKMVSASQSKAYEQIRKKVRARIDASLTSRNFEFVNCFLTKESSST